MPRAPEPPPPEPVAAPDGLSERSRALWRAVVPRYVRGPQRRALLEEALAALDRAAQAREAIAREGLTTTTGRSGVVHLHPLVRVEKDARAAFMKAWAQLRLDKELGPLDAAGPHAIA